MAHLQEGHYSFQLTVTDTAGQSSSEVVEVVVQTGENLVCVCVCVCVCVMSVCVCICVCVCNECVCVCVCVCVCMCVMSV